MCLNICQKMKLLLAVCGVLCLGVTVSAYCGSSYDWAGTTCSGGETPGITNLVAYLERNFGNYQTGTYNCRRIGGSQRLSLHGEGRAVDYHVTGSQGQTVFNHMIEIAGQKGIQEVIFNRRIWTSNRGLHAYNGQNPHTDHVHVGLNRCGARG